MLKLYNTLTKKKEKFFRSNIIIYSCGITVYDYSHIGHARIFIFFDTFIRYLLFLKINVNFIRNITDIDDKIINKAFNNNVSVKKITKYFINSMHKDNKKLKIFEPSFEPKATSFILNIIYLISFLQKKKNAYKNIGEDIYYNIKSNKFYGKLSGSVLQYIKLGVKNSKVINKKFDFDFTLWKSDNKFWASPWGFGRPGWHSECAAMNLYYSNDFIDIHSGGKDLLFPHHENELAQISSIKSFDFIKIWLHVGHIKVNNEKMSKSLGNHLFLKTILKKFNEEYLRYFFLLTHYRKEINYSFFDFKLSNKSLDNFYNILFKLKYKTKIDVHFLDKFKNILNEDFNTPGAIAILYEIIGKIKSIDNYNSIYVQKLIFTLRYLGRKIGIFKYNPKKFLFKKINIKQDVIFSLLKKRAFARKKKDWILADKIRETLVGYGLQIIDTHDKSFFTLK